MIENNQIDEGFLGYLEDKDNPFNHIDYKLYLPEAVPHHTDSANPVPSV
jgi:hypothetical protein